MGVVTVCCKACMRAVSSTSSASTWVESPWKFPTWPSVAGTGSISLAVLLACCPPDTTPWLPFKFVDITIPSPLPTLTVNLSGKICVPLLTTTSWMPRDELLASRRKSYTPAYWLTTVATWWCLPASTVSASPERSTVTWSCKTACEIMTCATCECQGGIGGVGSTKWRAICWPLTIASLHGWTISLLHHELSRSSLTTLGEGHVGLCIPWTNHAKM